MDQTSSALRSQRAFLHTTFDSKHRDSSALRPASFHPVVFDLQATYAPSSRPHCPHRQRCSNHNERSQCFLQRRAESHPSHCLRQLGSRCSDHPRVQHSVRISSRWCAADIATTRSAATEKPCGLIIFGRGPKWRFPARCRESTSTYQIEIFANRTVPYIFV